MSMTILCDTREQNPYDFKRFNVEVARAGLKTGDYSLPDLESLVAVERKELNDLISCLTAGRDRFERELDRARGMACFAVVVEASMEDVARHRYTSRMSPHAALQSILAFWVRYGVPFAWAGSRQGGEYVTHWLLQKFLREHEARHAEVLAVAELETMAHKLSAKRKESKK